MEAKVSGDSVDVTLSDAERDQAIAAVQAEIAQLREQGFEVRVISDLGLMAQVGLMAADGEEVEVLVDPMGMQQRAVAAMRRSRLH